MREIEIVLGMIVDEMRHEILLNIIHVIVARKFAYDCYHFTTWLTCVWQGDRISHSHIQPCIIPA